jgi:hypothetical protein
MAWFCVIFAERLLSKELLEKISVQAGRNEPLSQALFSMSS